jgi:hypothetical protein
MARKAYTGSPVDSAVAKGIGVNFGSREIADVLVDGRRLGEIEESLRTPDAFEVRPETKYREVFAAAVAIVKLSLEGAELVTLKLDGSERERPDLLMRYAGREYGVEASRVEPSARARNALIEMEREINEAAHADETLRPRSLVVHFSVAAAAVATLAKGEQQKLRDEIVALLRGGCLGMIPQGTPKSTVFGSGTIAQRLGMSVAIEDVSARSSGYGILVRLLQEAAGDSLVQPILDALDDKRRSARAPNYNRSNPLWLVLEVTEQTGTFAESISAVGAHPTRPIDPFERVVVHDGRTWCVLGASSA